MESKRLTTLERMQSQELSDSLPTEALRKGYSLVWYNPIHYQEDPTILYQNGVEVYRWTYDPTMGEVWDKISEPEANG